MTTAELGLSPTRKNIWIAPPEGVRTSIAAPLFEARSKILNKEDGTLLECRFRDKFGQEVRASINGLPGLFDEGQTTDAIELEFNTPNGKSILIVITSGAIEDLRDSFERGCYIGDQSAIDDFFANACRALENGCMSNDVKTAAQQSLESLRDKRKPLGSEYERHRWAIDLRAEFRRLLDL